MRKIPKQIVLLIILAVLFAVDVYGTNDQQGCDYALLQEREVYQVGVRNFDSPLIRAGEDGQLEGVVFVLLDYLSDEADISFEYIVLDESATQSDYEATDFVVVATNHTGEMGFPYESSPYLSLPLVLLEQSHATTQRIGVVEYYRTDDYAGEVFLYDREVVTYPTVYALQQAMERGEVDAILISAVSLNMISNDFETQGYTITVAKSKLSLSLAFSDTMSQEEIAVFNNLLATVNQSELEVAALDYAIVSQQLSLGAVITDNPWVIAAAVLVSLFFIAVTAVIVLMNRRKALTTMMNVDAVAGVMTERKFIQEGRRILAEDQTGLYRLVSLDIDNFKYINEIYGYDVGTALLQGMGQYLSGYASDGTITARMTADRFVVMTPVTSLDLPEGWVAETMEHIQSSLQQQIGKVYKLYFSIGIYHVKNRDHDINVMLDYANLARQNGKQRAGTTVDVFTPTMQREIANNSYITSIMEQALEKQEFVLHYQPKISLQTGGVAGAEALVRWKKDGEMIPPYRFIPLFEKNGFIEALDYYVLRKTCQFLQQNQSLVTGRISVNLSGVTMLQRDVVERIVTIVGDHHIAPSQLDLEITESAFVDSAMVDEKVQQLRAHGFTISMDDFGAGVSSLNRLKNIEVDTLKIDREFIIDSLENPRGNQILRKVIEMAEGLQLETVAEGIETEEQRTFLREIGCDVGQGYFFARPLPEDKFIDFCKKHTTA